MTIKEILVENRYGTPIEVERVIETILISQTDERGELATIVIHSSDLDKLLTALIVFKNDWDKQPEGE